MCKRGFTGADRFQQIIDGIPALRPWCAVTGTIELKITDVAMVRMKLAVARFITIPLEPSVILTLIANLG